MGNSIPSPSYSSDTVILPPLLAGLALFGTTAIYCSYSYLRNYKILSNISNHTYLITGLSSILFISYILFFTYIILVLDASGYINWGNDSRNVFGWIHTIQYSLITPLLLSLITKLTWLMNTSALINKNTTSTNTLTDHNTNINKNTTTSSINTIFCTPNVPYTINFFTILSWIFFYIGHISTNTVISKWVFFTLGCICFAIYFIYIMYNILSISPKIIYSNATPASSPVKLSNTASNTNTNTNTILYRRSIEQSLSNTISVHMVRTWLFYILWWLLHTNGLNVITNTLDDTIAILIIDAICINFIVLIYIGTINGLIMMNKLSTSLSPSNPVFPIHYTWKIYIFSWWSLFCLYYTQINYLTPFANENFDIYNTNNIQNLQGNMNNYDEHYQHDDDQVYIPVQVMNDNDTTKDHEHVPDWGIYNGAANNNNTLSSSSTQIASPSQTSHLTMDSVISALTAVQYFQQQQLAKSPVPVSSTTKSKSPIVVHPVKPITQSGKRSPNRSVSPPFLSRSPRFPSLNMSKTPKGKENRNNLTINTTSTPITTTSLSSLSLSPSRPLSLSKRTISHSRFVDAATSPLAVSNDRIYVDPGQDESSTGLQSKNTNTTLRNTTIDSNIYGKGGFSSDSNIRTPVSFNNTVSTGTTPIIQLPEGVNLETVLSSSGNSNLVTAQSILPSEAIAQILGNLVLQLAQANVSISSAAGNTVLPSSTVISSPSAMDMTTTVTPKIVSPIPVNNTTNLPTIQEQENNTVIATNNNTNNTSTDTDNIDTIDNEITEEKQEKETTPNENTRIPPPSVTKNTNSTMHVTDRLHATATLVTQAKRAAAMAKAATVKEAMNKARSRLRYSLPANISTPNNNNTTNNNNSSPNNNDNVTSNRSQRNINRTTSNTMNSNNNLLSPQAQANTNSNIKKYTNEFTNTTAASTMKRFTSTNKTNNYEDIGTPSSFLPTTKANRLMMNSSTSTSSVLTDTKPNVLPPTIPVTNNNNYTNQMISKNYYEDDDDTYPDDNEDDFSDMPIIPLHINNSRNTNNSTSIQSISTPNNSSSTSTNGIHPSAVSKMTSTTTLDTEPTSSSMIIPVSTPLSTIPKPPTNASIPRRTVAVRHVRPIN